MHDTAHEEGKGTYLWVWAGLLILTAIEVVLAYEQIMTPIHMLEVLMILSVIKSALIIGWFMHLKGEIAVMKWTLMTSVVNSSDSYIPDDVAAKKAPTSATPRHGPSMTEALRTTSGVKCWRNSGVPWARTIASQLAPGGAFSRASDMVQT